MDTFSFNASDLDSICKNIVEVAIPGLYREYTAEISQQYLFDSDEAALICEYLKNPTKTGIWFFNFNWIENVGISLEIKNEIEEIIKNNLDRSRWLQPVYENKNEFLKIINSPSFVFSLFKYIYNMDKGEVETVIIEPLNNEHKILKALDTEKIKEKYKNAYDFFKNEIYFDKFNPGISVEIPFKTKYGIIVTPRSRGNRFSFISLLHEPLEKLYEFFFKIGKIENYRIRPEYSPEEKVFIPYFSYLERAFPYFITEDQKAIKLFKRSIDGYKDKDYENCIRTSGKIVEYYLKQIYETFFRNPISIEDSTIGGISSLIDKELIIHFNKKNNSAPDIKPLYKKTNELLEDMSKMSFLECNKETLEFIIDHNKETLELIRNILNFVKEDKNDTLSTINKKEPRLSLFPKYLKQNIKKSNELRNATSHDSSVPIGQYEAQKMFYYCITLIMWWRDEKNLIEWKDDQKHILEKTIERSKSTF